MSATQAQPTTSDDGPVIDDSIKVALAFIRTEKSIESLVKIGKATRNRFESKACSVKPINSSDMREQVEYFINQVGGKKDQPHRRLGEIRVTRGHGGRTDAWFKPSHPPERSYAGGTMHMKGPAIDAMLMAKLKPTKLKADFYKRYIFNMGLAVARGLVHCFFYTLVDLKEEPNLDNHDVADTWEEQTFGGLLLSEEDLEKGPIWRPVERPRLDYPLSLGKPGERRRWIVLPGNLMASIPRKFELPLETIDNLSRPATNCHGGSVGGPSSHGHVTSSTASSAGRSALGQTSANIQNPPTNAPKLISNTPKQSHSIQKGPALGGPAPTAHKPKKSTSGNI